MNTNGPAVGGDSETLHRMNNDLCDFAMRWEVDGDYMRCKACNRPQLASYSYNEFPHASFCKAAGAVEPRPWEQFIKLLQPLIAQNIPDQSLPGRQSAGAVAGIAEWNDAVLAAVLGNKEQPAPNWCRTCGKHRNDPQAVFCSDAIHHPAKSEAGAVVDDAAIDRAMQALRRAEVEQLGETKTPNNGARRGCMRAALVAALENNDG